MLALLLGSSVQAAETTTILTGKVRNTVTRSPIVHFRGVVDRVLVAPGDKVQKGQPLMRYVLQDEARRALQREINLGPGTEASKGQILDLQSQLSQVSAQRNKAKSLAATGLGSNKAFGRLEADVHALQTRISLLEESIAKQEANFALRMEELAKLANMAPSTFNRHFKEVTSLSPLQFHKRLRLFEAQRLMLAERVDAASAGLAVGYESPTQFNREYKRLFGEPPHRNITRLKNASSGRA